MESSESREFGIHFFMIPITEGLGTSCDHLVTKKGLSYTTAASDSTVGITDGRQMDFQNPFPALVPVIQ